MGSFLTSIAYRAIGAAAAPLALFWPTLKGRFGTRWADRLGFPLAGGQKPLWLHAASVGEAQSALTIVRAMLDNVLSSRFVLSVGTPAGLARAQSLASQIKGLQVMAPPLDVWGAPGRALDRVGPRALAIVETELWPELIRQAQKRGLPVMVLAGRMSQRSFNRYWRVRSLFQPLLAKMTLLAVIGDSDRRRYLDLGAREEATLVIGNPKFDSLIEVAKLAQKKTERPLGRQIVVAGSTEDREELLIVQSWLTQAEKPHLILAPRHLGRLTQITSFLSEMPLSFRLLSARPDFDWPTEPDVVVVDAYGALAKLYALADLAIVGGGFYAGQGHNPLEPAAFGVPILFGPHMSSFEGDCQELVAAGAARRATPSELPGALAEWLTQGSSALAGLAGRELLARRAPVGPRLAALVGRALSVPLP